MKYFTALLLLALSLFASESNIDFYNASKDSQLLCKMTANSYSIVSQQNSSIVIINNTEFFKMNKENKYINSSGCHSINKHGTGIIF
ncbi:hypothetical protein SAMN06314019_10610 [Epsilonproteobacteria bacterium SCGC AD-311-C15]|jgi:hypothetical protein|nr:hypothetical protein SAMN06314019_10610 [Epsilonproteobacteria bacterium SCGC AD-311-C15]